MRSVMSAGTGFSNNQLSPVRNGSLTSSFSETECLQKEYHGFETASTLGAHRCAIPQITIRYASVSRWLCK
jgi:hypothetical protein